MSIAAVVLAAGHSRRLGRPKQRLMLHGEMLVERAVRVATEAGLSPVIAVVMDAALMGPLQRLGAMVLLNRKSYEGMASSIVCGVRALPKVQGVVLMTCDQPAVRPEHLRELAEVADRVTGSGYAGKVGIPAYFPAESFAALLQLQGDVGARELLRGAHTVIDEALVLDVDTEEDVERALYR